MTATSQAKGTRARNREATERKLVAALETVILRDGFEKLGINRIAEEAGVGKDLIYRYFDGLPGLINHWVNESANWPSAAELIGSESDDFRALPVNERVKRTFVNYARALRKRPVLVQVMAGQLMMPSDNTIEIDKASARISDELTLLVSEISSENLQRIVSLSLILISSSNYLAIRATKQPVFYGLDLSADASWHHIEGIIADMVDCYLNPETNKD